MEIVKTFGNYIEKWCETSPERARWLLKTGWEAQNLKFRFLPEGHSVANEPLPLQEIRQFTDVYAAVKPFYVDK